MDDFKFNPFEKFNTDWALVTAGDKNNFNSMTISWGTMGTLWFKPIITIFIRPDRYTFNFLKNEDYFTVSFYDEKYREALKLMGSKSGRDINKAEAVQFTPEFLENGVTYKEAKETFVCKKLYVQQLNMNDFPSEALKCYSNGVEAHYMFIGEVVAHKM